MKLSSKHIIWKSTSTGIAILVAIYMQFHISCDSSSNHSDRLFEIIADSLRNHASNTHKYAIELDNIASKHKLNKINKIEYFKIKAQQAKEYDNHQSAILYIDSAIAIAEAGISDKNLANNLISILVYKGDLYSELHNSNQALQLYIRAVTIMKNDLTQLCLHPDIFEKLGQVQYNLKMYNAAAASFKNGFDVSLQCNADEFKKFVGGHISLSNTALSYSKAGNIDSAEYYFEKSIAFINKHTFENPERKEYLHNSLGVVEANYGALKLKRKQFDDARLLMENSIRLTSNSMPDFAASTLIGCANLYLETNNLQQAEHSLQKSKIIYPAVDSFSRTGLEYTKTLIQLLYRKNLLDSAISQQYYYRKIRSVINAPIDYDSANSPGFELEQIEHAQNRLNLINTERRNKLYSASAAMITLVLLLFVVFIRRRVKRLKRQADELIAINNEIEETNSSLLNSNNQISAKQSLLKEALYQLSKIIQDNVMLGRTIAHDIRNPLSGIKSLSYSISKKPISTEDADILKDIYATSSKALTLVEQLSELNIPTTKTVLNLHDLFKSSFNKWSYELLSKKLSAEINIPEILIFTEKNEIKYLIDSLTEQAISLSAPGSQVKIDGSATNELVELSVSVTPGCIAGMDSGNHSTTHNLVEISSDIRSITPSNTQLNIITEADRLIKFLMTIEI